MARNYKPRICRSCSITFQPEYPNHYYCTDHCRFDSRTAINTSTDVIDNHHCEEWTGGSKTELGYGWFHVNDKMIFAHRYSYERHHGPIPDDKIVRHKCDNPSCVSPHHLELGSMTDNMTDKFKRGRSNSAKLSWDDAYQIKYHETGTRREIAKKYGVASSRISAIKNGYAWKHV